MTFMKAASWIGIIGFFICLVLMYIPNGSIQNIQKYNDGFKLLDMQFKYKSKQVEDNLTKIGKDGRDAYRKYLILDFIFIICFLITMLTITGVVVKNGNLKTVAFVLCLLRSVFDIIENILLLRLIGTSPKFSHTLATICSWATTLKFIMLYSWLLIICVYLVGSVFTKINR